jgi:hypothetical protein
MINLSEGGRDVKFEITNKNSNIFLRDEITFEKLLRNFWETFEILKIDINRLMSRFKHYFITNFAKCEELNEITRKEQIEKWIIILMIFWMHSS